MAQEALPKPHGTLVKENGFSLTVYPEMKFVAVNTTNVDRHYDVEAEIVFLRKYFWMIRSLLLEGYSCHRNHRIYLNEGEQAFREHCTQGEVE